jgi:exodeoxyribonuclease VII large subunit
LKQLSSAQSRLTGEVESVIELAEQRLQTLLASSVFRNPLLPVRNRQQQLDEMGGNLAELLRGRIEGAKEALRGIYEKVVRIEPHRLLGRKMVDINELRSRANAAVSALLARAAMQITAQENRLAGLNPRAVLKRGYSITTLKDKGIVIRTTADVQIGDTLVTELAGENLIESKVTRK